MDRQLDGVVLLHLLLLLLLRLLEIMLARIAADNEALLAFGLVDIHVQIRRQTQLSSDKNSVNINQSITLMRALFARIKEIVFNEISI